MNVIIKQKRSFLSRDELDYGMIGCARISPDGKWVVYELTRNDVEKESWNTSLWRINLENGETRQLTFFGCNCTPEWSPDGEQIAFISDRAGRNQIFILPVDGGEANQFTNLKQGVGSPPVWSPDGKKIAFTAGPDVEPPDPHQPIRITRRVYRMDGVGYLDDAVQNVYIQSVDQAQPEQLTDDLHIDCDLCWSPDGLEILYLAANDPDRSELFNSRLRVVKVDGKCSGSCVEEIYGLDAGILLKHFKNGSWKAGWTCDRRQVIFGGITREQPLASKVDLYTLDRQAGMLENRTTDLKWGIIDFIGKASKERTTFVNVANQGRVGIFAVALTGNQSYQQIIGGDREVYLLDMNDKKILFLSSTRNNPGELCIANLDGSDERQITSVNRAKIAEIAFPRVEHLLYDNGSGIRIEGWLLLPVIGEPPYPTILCIHGGPNYWFGYGFIPDVQMLAGAGYAVLLINPQGSRGYGNEFMAVLNGNRGVLDVQDLMAGVDHVVEKGYSDPDRLGVYGLSYGGFMTCYIVGQTDRFKAAVAENPITDAVSFYGTSDMGPWGSIYEMGGKPHEIPDVYHRTSPISYAHRCKTPTLLIQCQIDYRCPAGQSEQFYAHLKANNCITEMLVFPGVSHLASWNGPYAVQKAQNDALLEWMNRYVLGEKIVSRG